MESLRKELKFLILGFDSFFQRYIDVVLRIFSGNQIVHERLCCSDRSLLQQGYSMFQLLPTLYYEIAFSYEASSLS